jgi:2-polyprenyl-3-methyl-5-hydroxy-6-metoxy-1,4-benzoquinol methylase
MNKKVKGRSKKMKFKIGDACKLGEKDNNYDFVFPTDMLEHIHPSQRIQCIKEGIRICNDTCVIGFPC